MTRSLRLVLAPAALVLALVTTGCSSDNQTPDAQASAGQAESTAGTPAAEWAEVVNEEAGIRVLMPAKPKISTRTNAGGVDTTMYVVDGEEKFDNGLSMTVMPLPSGVTLESVSGSFDRMAEALRSGGATDVTVGKSADVQTALGAGVESTIIFTGGDGLETLMVLRSVLTSDHMLQFQGMGLAKNAVELQKSFADMVKSIKAA